MVLLFFLHLGEHNYVQIVVYQLVLNLSVLVRIQGTVNVFRLLRLVVAMLGGQLHQAEFVGTGAGIWNILE